MDSKPHVSLSTTQAAPSLALEALPHMRTFSTSSSTGSLPIRAPLTIDDDDSDFESNGRKTASIDSSSYSSDIESGTEGFVSGDGEFETASERPFVADPGDETLEENAVIDLYRLSRPFVTDLDDETSQNSSLDEEESVGVDEHDPGVGFALMDNPNLKWVTPIARLSMDDDDFDGMLSSDGMISEEEDNGFSGVVKVPGIDSVSRIKVVGVEGGEKDSFDKPELLGSNFGKFVGVDNRVLGSEEATMVVKNSVNDPVSSELVEDKGFGVTAEARVQSLIGSKEDVNENSELDKGVEHSVGERPALESMEEEWIQPNIHNEHEVEELSPVDEIAVINGSEKGLDVEEVKAEAGESINCQNGECGGVDVSGSILLNQGSESEKLENKIAPELDLSTELRILLTSTKNELRDNTFEGNGIQTAVSEISQSNPTQETMHLGNGNMFEIKDAIGIVAESSILDQEVKAKAENEANHNSDEMGERGLLSYEDVDDFIFGNYAETSKEIANEREPSSLLEDEGSQEQSQGISGRILMDSGEEEDIGRISEGKELSESAALAALLKAASSAELVGGGLTITSADGSRVFTLERPSGSNSSFYSLRPAPSPMAVEDASGDNVSEEEKERIEKIQLIRVKFLRLVQRLYHSPDDSIVAEVLYRLAVSSKRHSIQAFSLESAQRVAMQLEAESKDDLDFSLNILVLGKTGVGKSATINSIFREVKATIGTFEPATTTVKEIVGTINGVKIRILDTPGLRSPVMEERTNQKIIASIKKCVRKFPPDVVLYVDRLDMHTRGLGDLPLLMSLTSSLGSSIWRNAIVILTHAASAAPDGPSGSPLSYEVLVAQRSHVVQQAISQAVGDLRLMSTSLMHPVFLVENHASCQKNRNGESVLPNGQTWRPQLLLLCYSLKILSEVNSISQPYDVVDHKKLFGFRLPSPPLPYLLSTLLRSRAHPKLSADQGGDDVDSDIELGNLTDSDEEDEDVYEHLPPFKPLKRSQVAKLSREQRKAYFEEYEYRVKLLQKKQWRKGVKRMREMKKKGTNGGNNNGYMGEDGDLEDGSPAPVQVPLPDMVLPPSFDGDNPAYRYRFLEPTSQLLVRPVLDSNSWDHDCGYDGISLQRNLVMAGCFPGAFALQITKDKRDFNLHLDSSVSAKHGEIGSTMAGFDIQTMGSQLAYILRGETKFKSFKVNKTAAGLSITLMGENVATGLKFEDQIAIGRRLVLAGSAGAERSQGDTAYGANLEVRLKDKDFPIGQDQSTLGLSLVKWRGDLGFMANLQSHFTIGRSSKIAVNVGINNKRSGQITLKINSSEQIQMALVGILPMAISIFRSIYAGSDVKNSKY